MVNEKYLLAVESLTQRNKNRLNPKRSLKEQEKDELFYWIISRLEWSMQGCWPAKTSHSVTIRVSQWYDDGKVLLEHGSVSYYLSEYIKSEEFYTIMEEVANSFNKIGKSEEKGYHFYAVYSFPELIVHMTTIV